MQFQISSSRYVYNDDSSESTSNILDYNNGMVHHRHYVNNELINNDYYTLNQLNKFLNNKGLYIPFHTYNDALDIIKKENELPVYPPIKPPVKKPTKPPVKKTTVKKTTVKKPPVKKTTVKKPPVKKPTVKKPPVKKPPVKKTTVKKPPVNLTNQKIQKGGFYDDIEPVLNSIDKQKLTKNIIRITPK